MTESLLVQKWNLHNTSAPDINMALAAMAQILWVLAPMFRRPPSDSSLLSAFRLEPLYNLPFQNAMISFAFTWHKRGHK